MPPLAGPRLMLCWTRQPVNTWTEPSSNRTGKWTVSSRLTSRRPWRASSERPMTSAAASKRRCAVWNAEARVSTAIWRVPIVTPVQLRISYDAPVTHTGGGVAIDGSPVPQPWTLSVIGDVNRLAALADLMTQQLRADRRVREATYRLENDVQITSVISGKPFVYAVPS